MTRRRERAARELSKGGAVASLPMTDEECRLATEALSDQIALYASLLV